MHKGMNYMKKQISWWCKFSIIKTSKPSNLDLKDSLVSFSGDEFFKGNPIDERIEQREVFTKMSKEYKREVLWLKLSISKV